MLICLDTSVQLRLMCSQLLFKEQMATMASKTFESVSLIVTHALVTSWTVFGAALEDHSTASPKYSGMGNDEDTLSLLLHKLHWLPLHFQVQFRCWLAFIKIFMAQCLVNGGTACLQ